MSGSWDDPKWDGRIRGDPIWDGDVGTGRFSRKGEEGGEEYGLESETPSDRAGDVGREDGRAKIQSKIFLVTSANLACALLAT